MLSDTILRLPAVKAATGLSRSTIYERVRLGTFPAPVPLGRNSVGWMRAMTGGRLSLTFPGRREQLSRLAHAYFASVPLTGSARREIRSKW